MLTDNSRGAGLPRLRCGSRSRRNRSSSDLGDANRRSVGCQYGIWPNFCGQRCKQGRLQLDVLSRGLVILLFTLPDLVY